MQLTSMRLDWSLPRTWFVTARLLEVATALAVAASAYQCWLVFRTSTQAFGPNGAVLPAGPPFLDRIALFAIYGTGFGQSPVGALVACLLVLAVLAVLNFAQPVAHAALLRWEVLAVWAVVVLLNLFLVASAAVGLVRGDPNAPDDETAATYYGGLNPTEQVLNGLPIPVICLLLLGLSAIWWLRLPEEFDEPDGEPVREPRRWRPAPAQDANIDDLTLDGVELIEPVERLQPRGGGDDGSTASGYDDYFRRF
jgi:hypothetical protein